MPASGVVDGVSQMVVDRTPTLTTVRHEDGEISWTGHDHTNGAVTYLPDHAALAQRYTDIFARFNGD